MTGNPRNAMVCGTPYLQNEFGDPDFFYVFNLILSFSTCSQSFKKICAWELLGANVLNFCSSLQGGLLLSYVCEQERAKRSGVKKLGEEVPRK